MSSSTQSQQTRFINSVTPEQIRLLLGIRDGNLRRIQQRIPVRVVTRDGRISLTGEADALDLAMPVMKKVARSCWNEARIERGRC